MEMFGVRSACLMIEKVGSQVRRIQPATSPQLFFFSGLSPGGNSQWIIWVFNLVLVLGILIRLYVYGEPVLRPNTEAAVRFWSLSRKADLDIARVNRLLWSVLFLTKHTLPP